MGSHYWVCIRTRRVHSLWIIHGSPVEGRLNWDVLVLSRVLGGIPGVGSKVLCSAQHWCQNPGNESHNGLGSLVVPCYGLSARYFPFLRVGLGSCRPLPASRAEAWNVHGVAHVVTGPCPGGAAALPWVTCCVYCFLPGFGLWGIVDAQYILNTSSTSLSSHMPVCAGLGWGMLDGATRGRCLIVLWGRERCPRIGYTAVMVAVVCMPGCGLGGIWICTLYFGRRYMW